MLRRELFPAFMICKTLALNSTFCKWLGQHQLPAGKIISQFMNTLNLALPLLVPPQALVPDAYTKAPRMTFRGGRDWQRDRRWTWYSVGFWTFWSGNVFIIVFIIFKQNFNIIPFCNIVFMTTSVAQCLISIHGCDKKVLMKEMSFLCCYFASLSLLCSFVA